MILTDGRSSTWNEGTTDKVAELRKQAMEFAPRRTCGTREFVASQPRRGHVDEGAELEWEREIARRVDELKAGTVKTIPWAEVRSRVCWRGSMGPVAEVEFHPEGDCGVLMLPPIVVARRANSRGGFHWRSRACNCTNRGKPFDVGRISTRNTPVVAAARSLLGCLPNA
jgi:hypothetical protein